MRAHRSAFTLVELSIVLVILGLLVGGVLSGQALIKAAQLRSINKEFATYQTTLGVFRDKYFAIPGDMPNATDYWTALHTNAVTCRTTPSTADNKATCNGDGNGMVGSATSVDWREPLRSFQHLANAGLVEGAFIAQVSGRPSPNDIVALGVNIPPSKYPGAGWMVYGMGTTYAGYYPAQNYGNVMMFGAPRAATFTTAGILAPEDAYNVDMKMDDGKPYTGIVVTPLYGAYGESACTTSTGDGYALATKTSVCSLLMVTGY